MSQPPEVDVNEILYRPTSQVFRERRPQKSGPERHAVETLHFRVESRRYGSACRTLRASLSGECSIRELQTFDFVLEVKENDGEQPVFAGAFAHRPAAGRFLYLSWKREGVQENPWGWRIKIPLAGIDWAKIRAAEKPGKRLAADVIGRRPHTSEPMIWRVEAL